MQFPQPLLEQIDRLGREGITDKDLAKKFEILAVALANLSDGKSTTEVHLLDNPGDYVQTTGKPPKYFSNPFQAMPSDVKADSHTRYDYKVTSVQDFTTWVDFANTELGGGAFGGGMLEEETMTLEMPELANAAAIRGPGRFYTRDGTGQGPLQSNPTPLLITHVHRTIALDQKLYKDGWKTIAVKDLPSYITPQAPGQEVHILAVAVPKLDGSTKQQTQQDTIDDLFNTFYAAYTEAKLHTTQGKTIINTGPIGTGDYKNSPAVVYVLQRLAAQQVRVDLNYWALSTDDQKKYEVVVTKIISQYNADKQQKSNDTLSHLLVLAQKYLSS